MNWINWKDDISTIIPGLIILELPPITKPKMKVQETHIDGVDGSVFEELGYQSYDKTVKIALKGNYDIDEVINYFSGEWDYLRFSNEPDKYYRGRIIDSVDYDRLLRFRTADVKFRVQPFKFSAEEGIKTVNITSQTYFNVTNNGNVRSKPIIRIYGSGTIGFKRNSTSSTVFTYTFPSGDTYVDIDCEKQDAYVDSTLKNRSMTGDFPTFNTGSNIIRWTGTVTKMTFERYSRWL